MHELVEVQLRLAGEIEYFITNGIKFERGECVIVEADRGLDYGTVISDTPPEPDPGSSSRKPVKKVIRKANPWDLEQIEKNRKKVKDLINICAKKVQEHKLPMKMVGAEYSFDRSKIIFYFTSDNRVDFRKLVKDLASIFRVRIELRQIGVRDEAKMLGGHGPCGRELCCRSFLKDFAPVTIKMAKVQDLPLNPAKISGLCGRLMCCLGYEFECYKRCCRGLPKVGKEIKTELGKGKVLEVNILSRTATVDLGDGKIKRVHIPDKEEK
ncbi:MAG: stage 0 sporulation protein [Candidatus Omnitrophica bacterium]|nr:stage 0 sporulation protein [Candidatus Omnitrophota bacterium]